MSTYAIGDIQGCYQELMSLLEKIGYNPNHDHLWFTGDLVNRGPDSLKTLRFVCTLPLQPVVVLGNHDLHLLAVAHGVAPLAKEDTSNEILSAPDRDDLLTWLRQRPLAHYDARLGYLMVHAGIYPSWSLKEILMYACELEAALTGEHFLDYLKLMYGNTPTHWDPNLTGWDRLRFITNVFTRMRFFDADGGLELNFKGEIKDAPANLIPWFKKLPATNKLRIIFGHWAALGAEINEPNLYHLDTACVWGGALTALRLEDGALFQVPSTLKKS